jgi:carbamoyl-phosphate synthase large subunit
MRSPLNVLVLGAGSNVTQSIQKALALATIPTRVVAACITPSSPGLYIADRAYISPFAHASDFIPWLLDVCEREQIEVVMSGSEQVLEGLAPHVDSIREQTGAVTIVSSPDVLLRGRDKLLTCQWLESSGLPVPRYADLSDAAAVRSLVARCGFPLIAKPRFGKGSDGILTLASENDLGRVIATEDLSLREVVRRPIGGHDLILQEYLGHEQDEYTVGCFCDRDGELRGTIVLRRTLEAGTTRTAQLGSFPEVRDAAAGIASALRPLGPCNVQLRLHNGHAVPFEINPRFSGTTSVRAQMGFNEVDAALRHFVLGEPVPALKDVGSGVALRYWNEVYVSPESFREIAHSRELPDPRAQHPRVEDWGRSS